MLLGYNALHQKLIIKLPSCKHFAAPTCLKGPAGIAIRITFMRYLSLIAVLYDCVERGILLNRPGADYH